MMIDRDEEAWTFKYKICIYRWSCGRLIKKSVCFYIYKERNRPALQIELLLPFFQVIYCFI